METTATAYLKDPSTAASYLGESVGTHYSSALRAAKAYGTYLAGKRESPLKGGSDQDCLLSFWRELLKSEGLRIESPTVLKELSSTPSHFYDDFLGTAETVYRRRYPSSIPKRRGNAIKSEHAQCLKFLRDNESNGQLSQFDIQNKVRTWTQLLRIRGKYQE
jgi:hypothetical protein